MDYDQEMAEKHSEDLQRLEKAEPGKQTPMIMGWLKDKRQEKGELAIWLLAKGDKVVQDAMAELALNRRNSDRLRIRAVRVIRKIGLPLSNAQMTQFGSQAMGKLNRVGVEMLGMVRASQCAEA